MNTPKAAPVAVEAVEREKFEQAYAPPGWIGGTLFNREDNDDYIHHDVQSAWRAWKVGRAELASPLVAPVGDAEIEQAARMAFHPDLDWSNDGNLFASAVQRTYFRLGAKWALAATRHQEVVRAEPVTPKGFALVPLRLTQEMDDVLAEEGWQWEDMLAAAGAITSDQYDDIAARPSELESVIACLGDDAAALRHINSGDEMADNMDAAARLLETFAAHTAPAGTVPLSQGKQLDTTGPIAYLKFWAYQRVTQDGNVDADEGLEVCRRDEVGADGYPAFPVWAHPPTVNVPEGFQLVPLAAQPTTPAPGPVAQGEAELGIKRWRKDVENGPVAVFYTDLINGEMVHRDDIWLAKTSQLATPLQPQDAKDARPGNSVHSDSGDHRRVQAQLTRAFDDGWHFCTKWANRDDLLSDMGSRPYTEGREICIAAILSTSAVSGSGS
jgi:hypothetical protein